MIRWLNFVTVFLVSCASYQTTAELTRTGHRYIASSGRWAVSGYLPEKPKEKVYVLINGDKIDSVSNNKPSGVDTIETEAMIFPGFMDMHSHVKYNILPLWDLAQSQFLNRFEWRKKYTPYKDAVSANMKGIKGGAVTAAVRWAEIKALTGGATAIQGIGGDSKDARDFAINNIENSDDFNGNTFRSPVDTVSPDFLAVYQKYIEPHMKKEKDYDKAYQKMLDEQGVTAWVNNFTQEKHTVGNGLKLLIGKDFGLGSSNSKSDFTKISKDIKDYLKSPPYNAKDQDVEKQIAAMDIWLFGKSGSDSYMSAKRDEAKAFDFLPKGGVLTIPSTVRRYIGMFEGPRKSALTYLRSSGTKAYITHLAEGMRKDKYNNVEYSYLKKFGLNKKGMVLIHGVGLSSKDFSDAARNDISIVWSPFSNLLLYGETLDVAAAKTAGVNVSLGVDWTPTGSKHILDELNIARRYLDHIRDRKISSKDLVDMVTINAAKALQMDKQIGKVERGYNANLTLLSCSGKDPYDCAVTADQSQVELVVVKGQGLYGEVQHIKNLARTFNDSSDPETLPNDSKKCNFQKALRLPSGFNGKSTTYKSVSSLEAELSSALRKSESKSQKANLDPLFNCEDSKYSARFKDYIEKELDKNNRSRSSVRSSAKLDNNWTPFALDESDLDDDHDQ